MAGPPVFISHPSSLEHDTGGHPEQAARIVAIERELESLGWLGFARVRSEEVPRPVLTAVHPDGYVEAIAGAVAGAGRGRHLDADTVVSEGSFVAALHSAGGAVQMVQALVSGDAPTAFSAHRPPGHHAEPMRPMGFCLFNNVAIAAQYALDQLGLARVMILDWDVHHGNGTNDIFSSSADVLFVSIHQSPLYPGTGAAGDVGRGAGDGYTVNLPVPPGAGDTVFRSLVAHVAVPLARSFKPQLILISAGFDAHEADPLADCEMTEAGYEALARLVAAAGAELGAPVGAVLEGGYALGALARSVAATMVGLTRPGSNGGDAGSEPVVPAARDARARLARWWPALA